jgi:hypothetical protein
LTRFASGEIPFRLFHLGAAFYLQRHSPWPYLKKRTISFLLTVETQRNSLKGDNMARPPAASGIGLVDLAENRGVCGA